jgi:hypothetical protein
MITQDLNATTIANNTIIGHSNQTFGCGVEIADANSFLTKNIIIRNVNSSGIDISSFYGYGCDQILSKNTIFGNSTNYGGGAVYVNYEDSHPLLSHSILMSNSAPQIAVAGGAEITVNYCNVVDSWPGIGNIAENPAFVDTAHDDYRLLWGSPCIDSGHPDSLDPDGTRADMGACFYDQSNPVRVLMTPYEIPFLIPESGGGTLTYALRLDTHLDTPQEATFWCDVTLPDSTILGPLLEPSTITVYPDMMLSWVRYQGVPESAPLGVFRYNAYAVVGDDTSKDSFLFGKLGFGSEPMDPWPNWGDPLGVPPSPYNSPGALNQFALHGAFPNPFNATTAISYQLSAFSQVSLRVYDATGRLIMTLVDERQEPGNHRVTFDSSNLASGVYLYRLTADQNTVAGKMVLLK